LPIVVLPGQGVLKKPKDDTVATTTYIDEDDGQKENL
jgi:hypothetical protein